MSDFEQTPEELKRIVLENEDEMIWILLEEATRKHGEAKKQRVHWEAEEANARARMCRIQMKIQRAKKKEAANAKPNEVEESAGGNAG